MKINYLNCEGKHKLFSFTTHDYKEITIDEKYFILDGDFLTLDGLEEQ
jgi:hypothetical protein